MIDSTDWKLNMLDFISVDCQVGLVVFVIGTPSETGMTEVEEDRFVCLPSLRDCMGRRVTAPAEQCDSSALPGEAGSTR